MINREKATAICIDLQERLMPAMGNPEELMANCIKLFKGLQVEEVPVIATQQYTKGLGETVPEIKEVAGDIQYIEKIQYSAYGVLKEHLKSPEESPYMIVFGIECHVCVLQTLLELKEAGYTPILVTDCAASRHQKDYDMALIRAQQEGIILATCESLLFELDFTAGTPRAKALQKVVK